MSVKKAAKKARPTTKDLCRMPGSCKPSGGCAYFLGFLGALIYYISTTTGFWATILGILKAAVWPVFLVHGLLKFIGA